MDLKSQVVVGGSLEAGRDSTVHLGNFKISDSRVGCTVNGSQSSQVDGDVNFKDITDQLFTDFDSKEVKIYAAPKFKNLAKMACKYACIPEKSTFIFLEKSEWDSFLESKGITTPLEINFDSHMLVIVSTGVHQTGGYSVNITSITEQDEVLVVDVDIRNPKHGEIITQSFTCTLDAVIIPKISKKIVFKANYINRPNYIPESMKF